jgi:hypothetical protein
MWGISHNTQAQAANQDVLGSRLDELVKMVLDEGLHDDQGVISIFASEVRLRYGTCCLHIVISSDLIVHVLFPINIDGEKILSRQAWKNQKQ